MSTTLSKRRKIDTYVSRGDNQKVKSNYYFVFSANILDWMHASNFTGQAKKQKHKNHEKEVRHISESISDSTPFHVTDCGEV